MMRSVFNDNNHRPEFLATFRLFSTSRQLGPRAWWLQFLAHFEHFRRCVGRGPVRCGARRRRRGGEEVEGP